MMSRPLLTRALDFLGLRSQFPYEDPYESVHEPADYRRYEPEPTVATVEHQRSERSEFAGVTIIRAEPEDMEEATAVADEIKHRLPVLLNLQSAPEHEATRIRDFLGGVTYGLNGNMRRIAEWVYICSPFDMPVERLILKGTSVGNRKRDDVPGAPEDF